MRFVRFLLILVLAAFGNLPAATIHEAIDLGDSAAVAAMLDANPALLGDRLPNGRTPLHTASYGNKLNIVAMLLQRGADVNATTNAGSVSLQGAAISGYDDVVKLLVENGANVNVTNQAGYTPLTNAALSGSIRSMNYLIDAGASIEPKTPEEASPLLCAMNSGNMAAVEYLINAGADPKYVTPDGESAIMLMTAITIWEPGIAEETTRLLKLFMEKGADPNIAFANGRTPLMQAAMGNDTTLLQVLLDGGANPDAAATNGATAFGEAVESGNLQAAQYLANRGARTDGVENESGNSALHFAVMRGELPLVEAVMPAIANPNLVNKTDMTPLDIAVRYGHAGIVEFLRKSGAKPNMNDNRPPTSSYLTQRPVDGEAYLWYLGNCGYLIKTRNHCLIFDYWTRNGRPTEPSIANGFINPAELKSEDVTVFVTHEHADHFDSTIFGWNGKIPELGYVFGFQPDSLEENVRQGYNSQPYEYVGPGMTKTIDGMKIMAVRSNDAGVGFIVVVDGLTIYHAGDLAGWVPDQRDGFISQIDSIYAAFDSVDIALVNVTGCHHQDTLALAEGTAYTIGKLHPRLVIPTHGFGREYYYPLFMNKFKDQFPELLSFCPAYRGDAIKFSGGRKSAGIEQL